jgi:hypothetical protein
MKYAKPRKIKKAEIQGREYEVEWADDSRKGETFFGMIELNDTDNLVLTLNPKQSQKELIDTCAHELCHALLPKARHPRINRFSNELAELLWKIGFRLKKSK